MDPVTKDYIDSRDEVVETRAAAIAAEIRSSVDAAIARSEARERISEARERQAEARDHAIERRFVSIESRMDRVEKGMASLRITVVVTGISVVLGIAGLNAAIMQNMQAAFDSGRMVSAAQAEVVQQARATDAMLRQIDVRLAKTDEQLAKTDKKLQGTSALLAKTEANVRETSALLAEIRKQVRSGHQSDAR